MTSLAYLERSALTEARAAFCDLLIGRYLRWKAVQVFERGLFVESLGGDPSHHIDAAAHWEWMAVQAEAGCIAWGGRLNRCGYQPLVEEL